MLAVGFKKAYPARESAKAVPLQVFEELQEPFEELQEPFGAGRVSESGGPREGVCRRIWKFT